MKTVALAIALNLSLALPNIADAAPSNISKPKSTSHVNLVVRNNPAKTEPAMRGRLKLAQDAMVISQSQLRAAQKRVVDTDKAHDVAHGKELAASKKYQELLFKPRARQSAKNKAKAAYDKASADRTAARTRYRDAQTMVTEFEGKVRQNTAVSVALRRSHWDLVDNAQAQLIPIAAPPLNPGGGN